MPRSPLLAARAQAEDLPAEIAEYELLRSGAVSTFEASSLAELPALLVKARIARGWTQRDLADALGVAEQQMQRYEATGYRAASLARLCDVAEALNVIVTERAGSSRRPDRRLTTRPATSGPGAVPTTCPEQQQNRVWKGQPRSKAPRGDSPYLSGTLSLKTAPQ